MAGCTLLTFSGGSVQIDPLGLLLAVGAGVVYALFTLAAKVLFQMYAVEVVIPAIFCCGALLLIPLVAAADVSWLAQPRGVLVALHLGLITGAVAYLLFGRGVRTVAVSATATLTLAEPLTAGILGFTVLGEQITLLAGAGIGLLVIGLVILSLPSGTAGNPQATIN